MIVDQKLTAVDSAVGGSACPQADDRVPAIALGTTRSTINALPPAICRERPVHSTAGKRCQWSVVSGQWSTRRRRAAFTLAELLVSMGVLVLLVLLFTQLLNSAATVTILGHKLMDADSEARQVFDRMAIDFAQMVKRSDVDYYVKYTQQQLEQNDQIAFYSAVPGYYPSTGAPSPLSLVAYRVNSNPASPSYNKLERLAKGLVWNGVPTGTPAVFKPLTISGTWLYATNQDPDPSSPSAYEVIGPDVFRFEYSFMLTSGALKESPCFGSGGNCVNDWGSVAAIVVTIAVIDPRSKVLLTGQQIASLNSTSTPLGDANFLVDFDNELSRPGDLRNNWKDMLNTTVMQSFPHPAVSGIRVYERYFYLTH